MPFGFQTRNWDIAGIAGLSITHLTPPSYCQSMGISILKASVPIPCWSIKLNVFSFITVPVDADMVEGCLDKEVEAVVFSVFEFALEESGTVGEEVKF